MAGSQVRVLYSFDAQPGTGELSVNEGEILTVTRVDVGEGWWEGTNNKGMTGLFPAAYVEDLSSAPPPMPPPPLPSSYANTSSFSNDDWTNDFGFALPATTKDTTSTTTTTTTAAVSNTPDSQPNIGMKSHSSVNEDDWDDEWDDDDSEPGTLNTNGTSMYGFPQPKHIVKQTNSISDISEKEGNRQPVRKSFNRFSVLAKTGLEDYLAGLGKFNVDDIDKVFIDDDGTAPYWRTVGIEFSCSITSPKKESKFHGMKSFIAYTITPSFTNQPVSRRYKHFDWLHDRLSVKFSMIPIPPLPEKQISGRFEDDLIEYRMTMLQSWIDRICHHPVLGQCDVLKHFLTCPNDEKTWKAGKRKAESDKLVGVNFYQAVQRPDVPLDVAITENKLESYNRFFSHLDEATKLLQGTCVDQIKKHQGAFKREYTKISHSFSKLSRAFDMDPSNIAPHLTDGIRRVSDAYQEIGTIFEQEPKHDWEPLSNLLYEYKGLIDGFPSIISAAKNSIGKRKQLEKDAQEGKADIDQLPPVINRSDTVVYALHAEVTNFHHQRQRDFKNAMTSFLTEQISFYQKVADQLRDTLQHFNEI
ncbi:UNVERIFIED_CONTAM: hypothetical protein RMT77_001799 [Armadillidium vulgare]